MMGFHQQRRYMSLVQKFQGRALAAHAFCAQFTTLWVRDRDETYAKRAA